jgi:putative FmdB family regulatory protein
MPFYEYECSNCRFYVEVLQKISEKPLKKCPSCGKQALKKLVSAPVFRLKGSGWYETDFKSDQEGKRNLAGADKEEASAESKAEAKPAAEGDAKADPKADAKSDAKPDKKADAKSDAKSDSKSDTKADAKSDTRSHNGARSGKRDTASRTVKNKRAVPNRPAAKKRPLVKASGKRRRGR